MADPVTDAPEESRVDALPPSRGAHSRCCGGATSGASTSPSRRASSATRSSTSPSCGSPSRPAARWGFLRCASRTACRRSCSGSTAASSPTGGTARRVLVAADLVRAAVLIPVAIAGLAGELPLWGLVVAAFLLTSATSYFDPAYGALLPAPRRPSQRPAGERARARDCRGAFGRRLGGGGRTPRLPARQRLLRPECGDLPGLGGDPRNRPLGRRQARRPGRRQARGPCRRLPGDPCPPVPRGCGRRSGSRGHDRGRHLDRRDAAARQREPRSRRGRLLPRS